MLELCTRFAHASALTFSAWPPLNSCGYWSFKRLSSFTTTNPEID